MNEWENEPDYLEFKYRGFNCEIKRHPKHGGLRGYVWIPHQYRIVTDMENITNYCCLPIEVHGGVTYGRLNDDCDYFVIGFDCHHENDLVPYEKDYEYEKSLFPEPKFYRTIEFVTKQLHSMVDQIIAFEEQK